MKKIALTCIALSVITQSFSQNVFSYGNHTVTKKEFVTAFNKNPNATANRQKALEEYLDLYIKFKLKVQAAYDAGLDKDATQQYELQNFKRQIADNIINNEANIKELVNEAFIRSQQDIHLKQVFVELPATGDTLEAFKKVQAAYAELKGGKDFGEVSAVFSSDEAIKKSKGDLGHVSVFTLPYRLETIAYNLKPNTFSAPFKTKAGYHIFKNAGERKSLGTCRVAQILVTFPPNGTANEKAIALGKADSIYNLIKTGADFNELAGRLSNDLSSSNNKGELPEFSAGTYSPDFESAAFALKTPGDISRPFETVYGYHIIKLLEAKPPPSDLDDEAIAAALTDKVAKDGRLNDSKQALISKKLGLLNYKPATFKITDLFAYTDSVIAGKKDAAIKGITQNTMLFTIGKQAIKAKDWTAYILTIPGASKSNYPELYKQFIYTTADEYYRNHLEDYNSEYLSQVKEFKEANMLFAVMEKNVWNKSNSDTVGLQQYYNQHKAKYIWSTSADAIIITCKNEKQAEEIKEKIRANINSWREATVSNDNDISADSGRYELGQLPVIDRTNFTPGIFTAPVKNQNNGTYTFNYIIKVYEGPDQRSFEDAKGLVISDYQQVLEDKWIAELKKKYPVKINQAVFKTIK